MRSISFCGSRRSHECVIPMQLIRDTTGPSKRSQKRARQKQLRQAYGRRARQNRSTRSVAKDLTPIGTSANSETNTHGVHGVHGVQNEQGLRNNAVRPPPRRTNWLTPC